jgi:hypothetical protein
MWSAVRNRDLNLPSKLPICSGLRFLLLAVLRSEKWSKSKKEGREPVR